MWHWEHLDPSWWIRDPSWWIRDRSWWWIRNYNPSMSSRGSEAGIWGWKTNVGIDPTANSSKEAGKGLEPPGTSLDKLRLE